MYMSNIFKLHLYCRCLGYSTVCVNVMKSILRPRVPFTVEINSNVVQESEKCLHPHRIEQSWLNSSQTKFLRNPQKRETTEISKRDSKWSED